MKKAIITFLILNTFLSCSTEDNKTKILGSWYSCSSNGDYVEMHIKENQYKYSTDFGIVTKWNEFEIKGNTIFQYDKYVFEDSTIVNKANLYFLEEGMLTLEYFTSDEDWVFHRLDKAIINIDDNAILNQETKERSNARKCIDQRTEEEKKKDSLDTQVDFQF